jgi:hypothetical protein
MKHKFPSLLIATCVLFAFACSQTPAPAPVAPLSVKMENYQFKKCAHDSLCATIDFTYPVLSGGKQAAAIKMINDTIQFFVKMTAWSNPKLDLKTALDSAGTDMYSMLTENNGMPAEYQTPYSNELRSKVLLQNSKYLSIEMNNNSFMGGAHGNYGTGLNTFDLNTGKYLALTDIIADTNAIRPMLEKAFLEEKQEAGQNLKITDLLFPDFKQLPMPMQWCVVPEGVLFIYNPYEVAAYALGLTEITLTWAQLGTLADQKKWLE